MIKFIKNILGLCTHNYKIIEKIRVKNEKEQVVAFEFITQCDKCGKLKRIIFD